MGDFIKKTFGACLDCIENPSRCVSTFSMWVSCTIYGICKYFFQKNNFKIGFYSTIHTFKNYFITVFSVFNFQISVFSNK